MMIVCMILSSLALLAAVVNITLFLAEKKREAVRWQATLDDINTTCKNTMSSAETHTKDVLEDYSRSIDVRFERQQRDIDGLKSGACPDYEKALAAANAVNDFNAGISAIMNFDPIAAARKQRLGEDREVG